MEEEAKKQEVKRRKKRHRTHRKKKKKLSPEAQRILALKQNILDHIPENYRDLFPATRQMKRRFYLHLGPTNSGKTHAAIEAMKRCETGVYLGPLRLLAYEQFDRLNEAGYPTFLQTGEETIKVDNALYQASTIEMLDYSFHYECAVIDEAQMLIDRSRGANWTFAILGVMADEVHVCASPDAEEVLIRLIEECGDTYEIVRHERNVPLVVEDGSFRFPRDVQEKDALVVFSKRSVHACAAELQKIGVRCSIIYGDLPYDVRYEEARKFREGETQAVVATDAIGMGLNLPIRRICFLETEKFDGIERRPLKPGEIQQIAGRAGRYGMFDEGYCTSATNRKHIREGLQEELPMIQNAGITFPSRCLSIEGSVSELLIHWRDIPIADGYVREDVTREIRLAKILEKRCDDKQLIYEFITIPFDERSDTLESIWLSLFQQYRKNPGTMDDYQSFIPRNPARTIERLEEQYKICDLLAFFFHKFKIEGDERVVTAIRSEISQKINKILEKQALEGKKCKRCGKKLPWNYPFSVCEECHEMRYISPYGNQPWF